MPLDPIATWLGALERNPRQAVADLLFGRLDRGQFARLECAEFMQRALLATVVVALTCASLGVHVTHRKLTFLGDALAHAMLPGLVVAHLNGWSLSLGAFGAAAIMALLLGWVTKGRAVAEDTATGVLFTGMFAVGVFLMSAQRSYRDLSHMLFGNILSITASDLTLILIVGLVVLCCLLLFHKELELTSYDPSHAAAIGIRVDLVRIGFLLLLAMAVVTATQTAGVVLTSALIITPGATAALLSNNLRTIFALSAAVGVISAFGGLSISYYAATASGASVVIVCTALFAVARVRASIRERYSPHGQG